MIFAWSVLDQAKGPIYFPWKGSKVNVKFWHRLLVIGSFSPKISVLAFKSCQSNPSAYKHTRTHTASDRLICLSSESSLFLPSPSLSVQWACWWFFLSALSCLTWWQKPADPPTALRRPPDWAVLSCLYARWTEDSNFYWVKLKSTSPHLCRRSTISAVFSFSRGRCCV